MQGNTYIYPLIIKDIIKDTDEEVHRVRARRVLSAEAFVPVELGGTALPACGCVHQYGSFPNPIV